MELAVRRSKPYSSAVLVHTASSDSGRLGMLFGGGAASTKQIEDFLAHDEEKTWKNLLKEKGGEERLQILEREPEAPTNKMTEREMYYLMMTGGPPAEVLLLDEKLPTGKNKKLSYDQLSAKAEEVISLKGLSTDDIKDMLSTLL